MKRTWIIGGGVVVLVILLAGAAFIGGQLLTAQSLPALGFGSPGGNQRVAVISAIQPAPELPQQPADTRGLFDQRKDNSIFINAGTTNIRVSGGQVTAADNHTGPIVEIVVTHDTQVYRDVTDRQFDAQQSRGGKVQQVLEPGSLDEIAQYSLITVWGARTGDRITANVLVYALP